MGTSKIRLLFATLLQHYVGWSTLCECGISRPYSLFGVKFRNNSYHKDGHYSLSFGSSGGIQDYHEGHWVHVEVPVDRLFYPQYYQRLGIPA